jgi:hypothetical protein
MARESLHSRTTTQMHSLFKAGSGVNTIFMKGFAYKYRRTSALLQQSACLYQQAVLSELK